MNVIGVRFAKTAMQNEIDRFNPCDADMSLTQFSRSRQSYRPVEFNTVTHAPVLVPVS